MGIRIDSFGHPIYVTDGTNKVAEINKYFYSINFTIVDRTDNRQIKINDSVKAMRLSFNYKDYVFPILRVLLTLSKENYTIIRDHDVEARIDIYKLLMHDDSTPKDTMGTDTETYFTNELFTFIDKNKLIYNDDELSDTDVPSREMVFTLFSNKHLKINKMLFNGNYLNCRLVDILALSMSKTMDNILIEKPSNMNLFEQLYIPPINASRLPKYLQTNYDVYTEGLTSFFGFNEAIICNTTLSNTTPVNDTDYLHVILDLESYNNTNDMPYECGYKSADGRYYYVKTYYENIKISDKTLINQEIFGSRNMVFSKNENLDTQILSWEEEEDNKLVDKRQLYYDLKNSPFPANAYEINKPVKGYLQFNNLDLDTFKPNKLIFCRLNNKEYQFKIDDVEFMFKKDMNTSIFSLSGACILRKN